MKFSRLRAPFRTLIKIFYKFIFFPPRRHFFSLLKHNIMVVVQCVVRFVIVVSFFLLLLLTFLFFPLVLLSVDECENKYHNTQQAKPSEIESIGSCASENHWVENWNWTRKEKKNSNHRNKELESMISFQFSISNPMTEKKCEKSAAKKSKSANMKDFLLRLYCAKWRHMNSYPKYFLEQTMPRAASSSNSMRYYTSSKCCVQNINI